MTESAEDRSKALHSGEYVRRYERKPVSRISRLIPSMQLGPRTRLVDYACGNAMLLGEVHDIVEHYVGVDFSEDFIAAAKARAARLGATNCEFHCTDIVAFAQSHHDEFDVATALDFSEHVADEDLIPILAAIRRTLKPGGRLYLHTPNLDFFMERMRDSGFILKQRPEHIAVRDSRDNVRVLMAAGFQEQDIRVSLIPHYNILKLVDPLRHLPWVGRYFEARIFIECRR
ncbi:class I SAM-dependent methyltransferase [Luteimonas wenzhouensis]|jgi:2-polyprenyl-6-hydroxyphenyl methylase/3-demethylubiquinone-9 3-methyltransferase|uniref:Class I SAM-dependent methyltransferase n=1 Tax=Luteimonas wenzhouensis TaxID=2599615 RepID=A0A5C5U4G8_9GAMM|nr:class I SAM-dependent methyltransferase [Luteimonas wenzhouensis]NLW96561.1 class I SAM-dependent methyltransferase [Xanthomonadaceae bacterium]TWT20874.1 class I SAM-dependent methyltransferase [Luteimonas wenzhouensis]